MTHGTVPSYRAGCRCWPCYEAHRVYQNAFKRCGRPFTTPAARARGHLDVLRAHGFGMKAVSQLSGIGKGTIREIRTGRQQRIRRSTEEAILAVATDERLDGQRVDKDEALAIIKRVAAAGVTQEQFAAIIGEGGNELHLMRSARRSITVRKLRKIQVAARLLARQGIVPASVLEEVS